jgi:uncharacterized protein (TIGR04141 family)
MVKVTVEGLRELLVGYLEQYGSDAYKKRFPWVDQITPVEDEPTVANLNEALLEAIEKADFDRCWLAVPEPVDWGLVAGFRYGKRSPIHHDISFKTFLESLPEETEVDIPLLLRREVECLGADDIELHSWQVYRCINFEVSKPQGTYLLSNGKWYMVAKTLVQHVNAEIDRVPAYKRKLPIYGDETEAQYNERVAKGDPKAFSLMDRKLIPWGGGSSKFEFCDLYTDSQEMIHVKRYGGSAVLSHLFQQGVHSAELFVTEEDFRTKVNAFLAPAHRFNPKPRPDTTKHTVVFAVVSQQSGDELTLPFFSRLSLRQALRQLRGFGYQCALAKVTVDDAVTKLKKYKPAGKKKH